MYGKKKSSKNGGIEMCCKLNIMNQKLYHFDTAFYTIEFAEKYSDIAEANKALHKYYAKLVRIANIEKFHGISFGIGISNQDGQTATKTFISTGQKGRPQISVTSKKTKEWHIHCIIYGNGASTFCQEFIEYYRKKNLSAIKKYKLQHGANYVPYCYNQCIRWLTHGTFDFSKLYNRLEWKEHFEDTETTLNNKTLAQEDYLLSENKPSKNISNIFSYKSLNNLSLKTITLTDFLILKILYVIIRALLYSIYLYTLFTALEITDKNLERIYLSAIRLFWHASILFQIRLFLFRASIILQQSEDDLSHIVMPYLSVHFLNDHFWQTVHHIFVAIPYQFVLSL